MHNFVFFFFFISDPGRISQEEIALDFLQWADQTNWLAEIQTECRLRTTRILACHVLNVKETYLKIGMVEMLRTMMIESVKETKMSM